MGAAYFNEIAEENRLKLTIYFIQQSSGQLFIIMQGTNGEIQMLCQMIVGFSRGCSIVAGMSDAVVVEICVQKFHL